MEEEPISLPQASAPPAAPLPAASGGTIGKKAKRRTWFAPGTQGGEGENNGEDAEDWNFFTNLRTKIEQSNQDLRTKIEKSNKALSTYHLSSLYHHHHHHDAPYNEWIVNSRLNLIPLLEGKLLITKEYTQIK